MSNWAASGVEEHQQRRHAEWDKREMAEQREIDQAENFLPNLKLKLEGTMRERKFDAAVNETRMNKNRENVEQTYRQILNLQFGFWTAFADGSRDIEGYEEDNMFTTAANLPRYTGLMFFSRDDASTYKITGTSIAAQRRNAQQKTEPKLPAASSEMPQDGRGAAAASTDQPRPPLSNQETAPSGVPPPTQPSRQEIDFDKIVEKLSENFARQMKTQMQLMSETFAQALRQQSEIHGDQFQELNRRIR